MSDAQLRPVNWPAVVESALLAGVAVLLLAKIFGGVLVFYIHPRYTWLVAAAALVLLAVAAVRVRMVFADEPEPLTGRWRYWLLAVPLLLATLLPAQPLGAETLSAQGTPAAVRTVAGRPRGEATESWDLLDWTLALSTRQDLADKPLELEGFVVRAPDGTLALGRYVVTCCAADASGVSLPLVWDGPLPEGESWVRVSGTLGAAQIGGAARPAIIARTLTPTLPAANPYLYP